MYIRPYKTGISLKSGASKVYVMGTNSHLFDKEDRESSFSLKFYIPRSRQHTRQSLI
jgi:hypothetical protein